MMATDVNNLEMEQIEKMVSGFIGIFFSTGAFQNFATFG